MTAPATTPTVSSTEKTTESSMKVLPVLRVKPSGHRTGFGKLQREAARRRRANRQLAFISVTSLAALLALFYKILVS